jgi:hypothetical protein
MKPQRIGRRLRLLVAALVIPILIIGAAGFYVANQAGTLPWQAEPTPIPVTPFANLPGSGDANASTLPPTPTSEPGE